MEKYKLEYDTSKWKETVANPFNTLQLFITNKCNLRCKGCFYSHKLGKEEMTLEQYKSHVKEHRPEIGKIILLGGEPTIHPELGNMLDFNRSQGLRTTIYTNGFDLKKLEDIDMSEVALRIGVYGNTSSEKPLSRVYRTPLPIDMVYMLRRDNVNELMDTANTAANEFNCKGFYISSIRDIAISQSFWKDTDETLPLDEYFNVVQDFVKNFEGDISKLHIARRGLIYTDIPDQKVDCCRFGNIFPDGEKIICPLDISRKITTKELEYDSRKCNKDKSCILRKIVLERK